MLHYTLDLLLIHCSLPVPLLMWLKATLGNFGSEVILRWWVCFLFFS